MVKIKKDKVPEENRRYGFISRVRENKAKITTGFGRQNDLFRK
jgi:hypothetical protein